MVDEFCAFKTPITAAFSGTDIALGSVTCFEVTAAIELGLTSDIEFDVELKVDFDEALLCAVFSLVTGAETGAVPVSELGATVAPDEAPDEAPIEAIILAGKGAVLNTGPCAENAGA